MTLTQLDHTTDFLGLDAEWLAQNGSLATAMEISQQPRKWLEAYSQIESQRHSVDAWLVPIMAQKNVRIIFTGAGTSSFIGDIIAASLRKSLELERSIIIDSIATTDIVGDPEQFFLRDTPTLLVSFARSGDSPESLKCVELAEQLLSNCNHLIITCNPDGQLANFIDQRGDALCIVMPEGTNDNSFAMTSSFSSMLVSSMAIFSPNKAQLEIAAKISNNIIEEERVSIRELAQSGIQRIVVLGTGCLNGTAKEAALKCLELSAGNVVALVDSPLGFRHGPKIVVNDATLVILLKSTDSYISKYDQDLLNEIQQDGLASQVVELSYNGLAGRTIDLEIDDLILSLPYIVYCQILSFYLALDNGVPADNPCPTGEVNRVVSGVTIHPYKRSA